MSQVTPRQQTVPAPLRPSESPPGGGRPRGAHRRRRRGTLARPCSAAAPGRTAGALQPHGVHAHSRRQMLAPYAAPGGQTARARGSASPKANICIR